MCCLLSTGLTVIDQTDLQTSDRYIISINICCKRDIGYSVTDI